jgi:uncharacterized protein
MAQTNHPLTPERAAASAMRDPVVLENDGQKIFGVIHRPAGSPSTPRPAVAIFHGLVGSKDQPHQLYVKLAEALARGGLIALRIDFRGRGDSEGETVDITPEADISDATKALDYLVAQPDVDPRHLGLIGHSWGGMIGACLAGRDARVAALVMWSSVPGGVMEWSPPFREIDGRQVAELWGNLVGRAFYEGLRHINTLREIRTTHAPLLIVYGTEDEAVSARSVEGATRRLTEAGVAHELVAIDGADHIFMRYEWEREAIDRTVDWLCHALSIEA